MAVMYKIKDSSLTMPSMVNEMDAFEGHCYARW